jgi:hypothetical protein
VSERGSVNVDRARVYRSRGWSYDRIARNQGVSASAVYYALNKHKRQEETPSGPRRSVYIQDEVWKVVAAWARKYNTSLSSVVAQILGGELPDVRQLEPLLAGPLLTGPEIWQAATGERGG